MRDATIFSTKLKREASPTPAGGNAYAYGAALLSSALDDPEAIPHSPASHRDF